LEAVLSRPQFLKYAPAEALSAFADLIRTEGTMFEVSADDQAKVAPPCRDGNDNILLALAQAAKVDVLVSSDDDPLVLNPWNGTPILTPAQFLAQYPS
jgi:predicted nucleic acid-binding protein